VFKNEPDEHGRQDFWKKYLDGIDDIRFFLGSESEYNEFLKLSKENNSSFKPLINSAGKNAFILKFMVQNGCVYIYDVTEKGNACYVYFDGEGSSLVESRSRDAKDVLDFLIEVFNPDSPHTKLDVKTSLVKPSLTQTISNTTVEVNNKNWKIIHSANWETLISQNLHEVFNIKNKYKGHSDGYR
jgi:hypothetical protein